jgi:DNA-binding LacI/PurR family transcriptional regulator
MRAPLHDIGVRSAERLLTMIIDGVWPDSPLLLPVTLIVRESSGPPPAPR